MRWIIILFFISYQFSYGISFAQEPKESKISPPNGSSSSTTYDLRRTKWGMSQSQVKANEKPPVVLSQDDILGYKTTLLGHDFYLAYFFLDNKLVKARYKLADHYVNKNKYLSAYDTLVGALKKKYGSAMVEKDIWTDDLYKNKPRDWGMAVATGRLLKFAQWKTKTTKIYALCSGENFNINVELEYVSIELEYLLDKFKKKETMDNL